MRNSSLFIAILLIGFSPTASADSTETLQIDGLERSFLLHLPPGHGEDPGTVYPVVLVFHGGGGNAESMARMTGMNELADEEGFIVAYPNGTGRFKKMLTFNGGNCCGYAMEEEVDDVAFVAATLDRLEEDFAADAKRVYATGLSNGGIITYRLADRLADRIAAIAPVGASMGTETCDPARAVPLMHIHGTNDEFLTIEGGYGKNRRTDFYSVDHSLRNWIEANRAEVVPTVTQLSDIDPDDGCRVEVFVYAAPDDGPGAEVSYVRIEGGGHTWPGAKHSPAMLGTVCHDIDANRLMWEFFSRHQLP